MRDSFIFYRSFYEAIKELDDDIRLKILDAILSFALDNEEFELKGIEKALFSLIKPQIEANQKRYDNGKKGGKPKKETIGFENNEEIKNQNITKTKPNDNQNITKTKPNKNENVNENENENENANENPNLNENENENDVFFEEIEKMSSSNSTKSFKNPDLMFNQDIDKVFEIYANECFNLFPIGFAKRNREFRAKVLEFLDVISGDFSYFTDVCRKANELKTICNRKIDIKAVINNHDRIYSGFYNREDEQDDDAARHERIRNVIDAEIARLSEEEINQWNTI